VVNNPGVWDTKAFATLLHCPNFWELQAAEACGDSEAVEREEVVTSSAGA
jgi:hypothetical protein